MAFSDPQIISTTWTQNARQTTSISTLTHFPLIHPILLDLTVNLCHVHLTSCGTTHNSCVEEMMARYPEALLLLIQALIHLEKPRKENPIHLWTCVFNRSVACFHGRALGLAPLKALEASWLLIAGGTCRNSSH